MNFRETKSNSFPIQRKTTGYFVITEGRRPRYAPAHALSATVPTPIYSATPPPSCAGDKMYTVGTSKNI